MSQVCTTKDNGKLVIFRCSECGAVSVSLGWIHGHIEKHRGYTRFKIPIPFTRESPANVDELMKRTEILVVEDHSLANIEEVSVSS